MTEMKRFTCRDAARQTTQKQALTLPLLTWLQSFLGADFGPFPWVGLSFVVALYMALAGAAMAVVSRLRGGPVWMAATDPVTPRRMLAMAFTSDSPPLPCQGTSQPAGQGTL